MPSEMYRYTFGPGVSRDAVEDTLTLVLLAVAGLHGDAPARLEAAHTLDRDRAACVIEARGPAGRDANVLFLSFLTREFGPDAFTVERVGRRRTSGRLDQDRA